MKRVHTALLCLAAVAIAENARAIDLKQSKLTQVVNDVEIIPASGQRAKPAAVDDIFTIPDILRTGRASRAELVAADETVTRVGADTIFSFDPATRTLDLKQGSLLFHSPHGKGGGTIHTGSATASVLGTTLIVSTTGDGGMKVLDLEGKVEVNYENKARQKLQPGQMTFVLPGGRQLAPIVVFRLDELVRNSLLVHGFSHPLSSLPLIQNQVNYQNKLIKSGKATDTGLLVGDRATPNQVEVIDPNSIQSITAPPQNIAGPALNADATIAGPSLADPNIPIPPARIFLDQAFVLPGNPYFSGQSFKGFAGQNILFTGASPLTVDLGLFASAPIFDIVARQNITMGVSTVFSGLGPAGQLSLIGGQGFSAANGITLQADVADFEINTPSALAFQNVSFLNKAGKLGLSSGSSIQLNDVDITLPGSATLTAPNSVAFYWTGVGYINKSGLSVQTYIRTDPASGHASFNAPNGNLYVYSTSIQTHYLTLNSGDSILLDAKGQTLAASGAGSTASFTAKNVGTVDNANLSGFAVVNMAANTINLSDVDFGAGSSVTLRSQNGVLAPNPNTGAASVPGDVNFIKNVTRGGNPAQNYVNNGHNITVTTLLP